MPSAIERWHSQQSDLPVLIRALRAVLFDRYHHLVSEGYGKGTRYILPINGIDVQKEEPSNVESLDPNVESLDPNVGR